MMVHSIPKWIMEPSDDILEHNPYPTPRFINRINKMLTGDLRSKVDKLWLTFFSGGISNPLTTIEQISYLLFLKRLDDLELRAEKKAQRTGKPIPNPIFSAKQQHLR